MKKISNIEFKCLFHDYESLISDIQTSAVADDAHSIIRSTIMLYTLEWIYSIELMYQCCCIKEKHPEKDIQKAMEILDYSLTLQCSDFSGGLEKGKIHTDNRFVLHRLEMIELAMNDADFSFVEEKIGLYLYIKYVIKHELAIDGVSILEYIKQNHSETDWANFVAEHYPLLSKKYHYEWTNKRIRYFREVVQCSICDKK